MRKKLRVICPNYGARRHVHVVCPDCAARSALAVFEREGCWHCNLRKQEAAQEDAFAAFMAQDEVSRWHSLWLAAGQPD